MSRQAEILVEQTLGIKCLLSSPVLGRERIWVLESLMLGLKSHGAKKQGKENLGFSRHQVISLRTISDYSFKERERAIHQRLILLCSSDPFET